MSAENEIYIVISVDCAFSDHTACDKDLCKCSCHVLVAQALATQRAELADGVREMTPIRIVNVNFDLVSKGEVLSLIEGGKG